MVGTTDYTLSQDRCAYMKYIQFSYLILLLPKMQGHFSSSVPSLILLFLCHLPQFVEEEAEKYGSRIEKVALINNIEG